MLEEAKNGITASWVKSLVFTRWMIMWAGLILWMPNGTIIIERTGKTGQETEKDAGYHRVVTPHIAKESMYLTSGHLPYYAD